MKSNTHRSIVNLLGFSKVKEHKFIIIIIIIIIILKSWNYKAGRESMHCISQKTDHNSTKPTHRTKEEKENQWKTKRERVSQVSQEVLTCSYNPLNKTVPQRYWVQYKSPAVLWGSAARKSIRSVQGTTCNTSHYTKGTKGTGSAPHSVCMGLLLIFYSIHKTATDRRWKRLHSSTTPVEKLAPLTTQSNSLRCVSAAQHHNGEQYSKTGRTKSRKHLTCMERLIMKYSSGLPHDPERLRKLRWK